RIGRKKIIMAGCLLAAVTYFPLFQGLTHYVNPALEAYQQRTPIAVAASGCNFQIFVGPWSPFTECDKAKVFLTKASLTFKSFSAMSGAAVVTKIGERELRGFDEAQYKDALKQTGYPPAADPSRINYGMTLLLLVIMVLYVTMVYGPIAAYLVEMFPTQ